MPEFAIRGVIPAVLTPFAQDGALDTALLQAEVAALDSAGVDAFCIGSVVGETVGSAPAEFGRICGAASAATRKPVASFCSRMRCTASDSSRQLSRRPSTSTSSTAPASIG